MMDSIFIMCNQTGMCTVWGIMGVYNVSCGLHHSFPRVDHSVFEII